mgnify:CR=1 FL=1
MNFVDSLKRPTAVAFSLCIALSCLLATSISYANQDEPSRAEKQEVLNQYEAAKARGDQTAAAGYVLEYAEDAMGENAPETVKLTHRYGQLLYEDGEYRKATKVLKEALERSAAAFGENGGEAFAINMNIGYTVSKWSQSLSARMKYFDRALGILRANGEQETIKYVTTLINIVVNLMGNDGLSGEYSSTLRDDYDMYGEDEFSYEVEREYTNYFDRAEKYVLEAVEISERLEHIDEYLTSKISIAQAKLKVMETADLANVPMGVEGYISGGTRSKRYDREEDRLAAAIESLSRDAETNAIYIHAANKALMEIAWLDKDKDRMASMCTSGTLNSASEYPPERLFQVTEDGMVISPELPFSISRNLFKARINRDRPPRNKDGNVIKRPYFVPVCIDGRVMAALIHAPRVTIEEIRK